MSAVPPSFRGLGRVGLAGGGAARSGRRTARPHARPAAPPIHHEDSQNEAAMTSEIWESISVRAADRHHAGPLPVGFSREVGAPWGQAFREMPPPEILAQLETETGPDWIPPRRRPSRQEMERPAWESDRLTHGQANIVRWFFAGLSGGSLRAFGCRAGSSVKEWIPRQDWMRLAGIDHGEAWRHMFKGISAFRLEEGARAWAEVRVTFCDQIDTAFMTAEEQRVPAGDEIPPRYAYRRTWSDEAKPGGAEADRNTEGSRQAVGDDADASAPTSDLKAKSKNPPHRPSDKYNIPAFHEEYKRVELDAELRGKLSVNQYMLIWAKENAKGKSGDVPGKQWVNNQISKLRKSDKSNQT